VEGFPDSPLLVEGFCFIGDTSKGEELSPISCSMPVFEEISVEALGEELVNECSFLLSGSSINS